MTSSKKGGPLRRQFFASAALEVALPFGRTIPHLDVVATVDEGLWGPRYEGRTDERGIALFSLAFEGWPPIRSKSADHVWLVFDAVWEDETRGVVWSGHCEGGTCPLSAQPNPAPAHTQLTLSRDRDDGFFVILSPRASETILSLKRGEDLLQDFLELSECIQHSLPTAGLNMAGRVLDDAIWIRGHQMKWPMDSWGDRPTLGILADKPEVRRDIEEHCGKGFHSRLKVLAITVRNLAAHQKQSTVSLDDARAARAAVRQLIESWWPGKSV